MENSIRNSWGVTKQSDSNIELLIKHFNENEMECDEDCIGDEV